MSKYLIYLRKSRQDDINESVEQVLAKHEYILQNYAIKELGYRIPDDCIYREVVSGETIADRPQINKLFNELQSNQDIAGVLIVEPSRLTRGDLLDCGTVVHIFKYTNTKIITPSKAYDLNDKYDKKFLEMELLRGNDYLEYTKEILARGREASARQGNYIGGVAPYGYRTARADKSNVLVIDENEAQYVRIAFELYSQGNGANSIAHKLNELGAKPRKAERFTSVSVKQMIENPVYIGKLRFKFKPQTKVFEDGKLIKKRTRNHKCELIQGKHEPIISDELYKKCMQVKGNVSREQSGKELVNIFAGLMKCKKCGRAIGLRPFKNRKPRYFCTSTIYCDNMSANVQEVNEAIINALKTHLSDFEVKVNNNNDDTVRTQEQIKNSLELELAKINKKQDELYDLLENKIYSREVFLERNQKLANDRERVQSAINNIVIPEVIDYKQKAATLHQALNTLLDDNISTKIKNHFLKEVIDVVYYYRNKETKEIELEIILK